MVHCDTEIVSKVRALLEAELGEDRFELWFGTETRFEWTEQAFRIAADSSFRVERLRKSLHREIESVVQSVVGVGTSVEFRVDEQLATPFAPVTVKDSVQPRKAVPDAAIESLIPVRASGTQASLETRAASDGPFPTGATGHRAMAGSRGRKFARFATLIRGASNQIAIGAAELVVRQPGQINPLFVHGPTGAGKTHLLEGIWSEVRRRGGRRIIYLSAEQFTTYFLQALRGSGLPSFRQKYRAVDLLVLDDVHFFAGKQATITELLHTIDALLRESRQVVLSADRPPSELRDLGGDLQARIHGGLVCAPAASGRGHSASTSRTILAAAAARYLGGNAGSLGPADAGRCAAAGGADQPPVGHGSGLWLGSLPDLDQRSSG